MADEKGT
jgi:hypothetical protein